MLWSAAKDALVGAACGYAGKELGGMQSAAAQNAHIRAQHYCGASPDLFANGAECGACYRLTHDGGPASGVVVQVVNANSAAPGTFNCHAAVLQQLGMGSGPTGVRYARAPCDTESRGPVAVLASGNIYYSKLVFGNLPGALARAELLDGPRRVLMRRVADTAQWEVEHGPLSSAVGFELITTSGEVLALVGCFPGGTVNPGAACTAPAPATTSGTGAALPPEVPVEVLAEAPLRASAGVPVLVEAAADATDEVPEVAGLPNLRGAGSTTAGPAP